MRLSSFVLAPPTPVDAGAIEITAPARDPIELAATGGYYPDLRAIDPVFGPGEVFTIVSEGGVVPAFEAEVAFPPAIEFTTPADPGVDRVPIPYGAAYSVAWTPTSSGFASLRFTQQTVMGDTQRVATLSCSFPAADGAATIPREAMLAFLPSKRQAASPSGSGASTPWSSPPGSGRSK